MLAVMPVLCEGMAADNAVRGYRSDMLQKMAEAMLITGKVNALPDGDNFFTHTDGHEVNVRISGDEVEHIGYRLFEPGQKRSLGFPLTDFLERYWLSLTLPIDELRAADARMREDHFYFITGDVSSVDRLQRDPMLMVNFTPTEKMLDVEWSGVSGEICHVVAPVGHELILGRNMPENDRRLVSEIRNARPDSTMISFVTPEMLVPSDSSTVLVLPRGMYYLDELKGDRYYHSVGGGNVVPVWSGSFPGESIANMFTGIDIDAAASIPLHIRHVKYGGTEEFDTDVRQFVTFCLSQGCVPYVGLVSIDEGVADVLVMMSNMQLGYNHMLRVKIATDGLVGGVVSADGRLNAYIPIANLKNLFKE